MLTINSLRTIQQNQQEMLGPVERTKYVGSDFLIPEYARIITGVRRCGKSTLLRQIIRQGTHTAFYLNFDDPRLYEFTLETTQLLDLLIAEKQPALLCFDEIQVLDKWEQYIRQKLDEGFFVLLTGSSASLLSRELGSRLTGRHVDTELFPFSYLEYLEYTNETAGKASFSSYFRLGGFPMSIKYGQEYLLMLFDDIIQRDILVRYGIRNTRAFKSLSLYLLSNVGTKVSANKLLAVSDVATPKSILEYFSYLESSYLFSFVPRYDDSYRAQQISPKKVYCIDVGLIHALTECFSVNAGHVLENLVFNELRSRYRRIYYYEQGGECDFIVQTDRHETVMVIQVCAELTIDNRRREFSGLELAMKRFPTAKPYVLTNNQEDMALVGDRVVSVLPVWKWLVEIQKPT